MGGRADGRVESRAVGRRGASRNQSVFWGFSRWLFFSILEGCFVHLLSRWSLFFERGFGESSAALCVLACSFFCCGGSMWGQYYLQLGFSFVRRVSCAVRLPRIGLRSESGAAILSRGLDPDS